MAVEHQRSVILFRFLSLKKEYAGDFSLEKGVGLAVDHLYLTEEHIDLQIKETGIV
jgi:hypothetical protein